MLADLALSGIPGGAFQGHEVAGVLMSNRSNGTCAVQGWISAQLLRGGNPIGQPGTKQAGSAPRIALRPGDTAEVQLTAVSTCQAPVSDQVRVGLPSSSGTTTVSVQLRACALQVAPISRA